MIKENSEVNIIEHSEGRNYSLMSKSGTEYMSSVNELFNPSGTTTTETLNIYRSSSAEIKHFYNFFEHVLEKYIECAPIKDSKVQIVDLNGIVNMDGTIDKEVEEFIENKGFIKKNSVLTNYTIENFNDYHYVRFTEEKISEKNHVRYQIMERVKEEFEKDKTLTNLKESQKTNEYKVSFVMEGESRKIHVDLKDGIKIKFDENNEEVYTFENYKFDSGISDRIDKYIKGIKLKSFFNPSIYHTTKAVREIIAEPYIINILAKKIALVLGHKNSENYFIDKENKNKLKNSLTREFVDGYRNSINLLNIDENIFIVKNNPENPEVIHIKGIEEGLDKYIEIVKEITLKALETKANSVREKYLNKEA